MQRYLGMYVTCLCLAAAVLADEPKSEKPAESPPEVFSPPPFEVPPGFTVEVAASTPLVNCSSTYTARSFPRPRRRRGG